MSNKLRRSKDRFFVIRLIYIFIIAVLLISLCVLKPGVLTIVPSIMLFVLMVAYTIWEKYKGIDELSKRLSEVTLDIDKAAQSTIINFPYPLVIIEKNGNVVWKSSKFISEFSNTPEVSSVLDDIVKEINLKIENEKEYSPVKERVEINNKVYRIIGEYVKARPANGKKTDEKDDYLETIYFIDETSKINLLRKYTDSKISVGIIMIDNYEELMQRASDEERTNIISEIEKKIYNWSNKYQGVTIKSERDTFICIMEQKMLDQIINSKFDILDEIKEIETAEKFQATLSIAFSLEGENNLEKYKSAKEVIDVALGRGGDQAIIKQDEKYIFFGGRTPEMEKRTKVKARIVATALEELMKNCSNVLIMGHTNSDIDAMGASMGVYRIATANGKEAYIVNTLSGNNLDSFVKDLDSTGDYNNILIGKNEALLKANSDSLVVVVDTYRKGFVDVPELLDVTEKIVVIDHHRKATDYIDKAILTLHEVYASSACELVTELIEYSKQEIELSTIEVEALYAGIMMDTKNFTYKTGVRTFEAAAFLRKNGVDVVRVKKWFQSGLETYKKISSIVANAEVVNDSIAIATYDKNEVDSNITCAKAADELLTINNITASFVLGIQGDKVYISGRSVGDINVQVILEKLGGGGHISVAGAQLEGVSLEDAKSELIERINEYFTEEE